MRIKPLNSRGGFTLVELLIGMTLSLIILGAVLSSYIFLGRNFTRSLGISSANQPTLESQARRSLTNFGEDVRMANGITAPVLPDTLANEVTLNLPVGSGTKGITYYYNSLTTNWPVTIGTTTVTVLPQSLTRIEIDVNLSGTTSVIQATLCSSLLSCAFSYYDTSGNPYTIFDSTAAGFSSFSGIKQISLSFTSQAGSSVNKTLTQVFTNASPRLLLRNKPSLQ